jgi:hypothetical protein
VKYLPEDFEPMSDLFCDIAYKFTPVVAPLRPGEVLVGPVGNSPCLARILHQCSVQ